MSRFQSPQRDSLDHSKYIKILAFFWAYLLTMYLLSLWSWNPGMPFREPSGRGRCRLDQGSDRD